MFNFGDRDGMLGFKMVRSMIARVVGWSTHAISSGRN
jgi:hypothetical protein